MTSADAEQIGLLTSGGLDSAILLGQLLEECRRVQPFYVRFGLQWEAAEQRYLERNLEALACERLAPLVTFDLPLADLYGDHWSLTGENVPDSTTPDEAVYLPGRNTLLVIKAALWCQMRGIDELALAALGTSPFADASEDFLDSVSHALSRGGGSEIRITRPFAELDKRQVMQLGGRLRLEWTFSCIAPSGDIHCGRCNKCAERQAAFREAEMADPTQYATPRVTA